MDPQRWRLAREIFDDLVDCDAASRAEGMARLCGDDVELRREVESLLAHDRPSGQTIEHVVAAAALSADPQTAAQPAAPMPATIGRYRVLEKLGEGGMGAVFLAEDASLGRRVAVKLPATGVAGDAHVRRQLQHEARAAATITHPHVCVVHEVSEDAAGRPFIAMEHVEGEPLSARIRRGALPAREVMELGRQAASALAAAHAKGVIHRDLKPSNIMLTAHGVKLLDFGLAGVAARTFAGTVPYMSPEQVRAGDVDHRTDLYSLGVVLYEALTGRRPFDAPTARATCDAILASDPPPATALAPNVPAALDRAIRRAMAKSPDDRYQSASEMAADLESSAPRGVSRLALAATAVALLVIVGLVSWLGRRPATFPAPQRDTMLVGDFTNSTNDPAFDGTLEQVLIGQLQQTPFLALFPDEGVRETLRLMSRSPEQRLTTEVALEICRRRGLKGWIAGAIAPRGRGYEITLEALDGQRGTPLTRERIEASTRVEVLPALGKIALQLRQKLGEPSPSIAQFSTPVEQAATASLDALRAYTLGLAQAESGNYPVAVSLYERAVQIDPQFAVAYEALAREQINSGYAQDVVAAAATRAYELRDRTTEQEQLSIAALYHSSVTGDLDRAIEAAERWKTTFPLEWRPFHLLGDLLHTAAQYEDAAEAAREAVRLNPDVAAAYSNLAGSLFALDRFDEARTIYRDAMARGLDAPEYHAYLWRIAYYQGDVEGMQRELDWAAGSSTWALNMTSLSAALQGRWREAQRASQQTTEFFEARALRQYSALAARYDTVTAALVGDCATAGRLAPRALDASVTPDEQARAIVALAMCGERSRAPAFAARLTERFPDDTMFNRVWLPMIRAASLLERQPGQAVEALKATVPYEGAAESWPIYLRGLALLGSGQGAAARGEFQKIIERRGRTHWVPFYPLAHLGLARAAMMSGDTTAAARAYENLFALWKDADADLPVLVQARQEYERIK